MNEGFHVRVCVSCAGAACANSIRVVLLLYCSLGTISSGVHIAIMMSLFRLSLLFSRIDCTVRVGKCDARDYSVWLSAYSNKKPVVYQVYANAHKTLQSNRRPSTDIDAIAHRVKMQNKCTGSPDSFLAGDCSHSQWHMALQLSSNWFKRRTIGRWDGTALLTHRPSRSRTKLPTTFNALTSSQKSGSHRWRERADPLQVHLLLPSLARPIQLALLPKT